VIIEKGSTAAFNLFGLLAPMEGFGDLMIDSLAHFYKASS
jgi:hypothetical protein